MAKPSEHFEIITIETNESINEPINGPKKRKKDTTAARRMRLYRQRQRGEIIADTDGGDLFPLKRPRAMTGAERIRLYRLRKKLAKENLLKENEYVVLANRSTPSADTKVTSLDPCETSKEAVSHQLCESEKGENSEASMHIKEELDIGEIFLIDGTKIKSETVGESSEHCNNKFKNDEDSTDAADDCFNPVTLVKIENLNDNNQYENDMGSSDVCDNYFDPDVHIKQENLNDNDVHEDDDSLTPETPSTEEKLNKVFLPPKESNKPIAVKIEPEIRENVQPSVDGSDSVKFEQFPSEIQFVTVKEEALENCTIPSCAGLEWENVHEDKDNSNESFSPVISIKEENHNENSDETEHGIHPSLEMIECEFCDYTADSQSNIEHHMERVHHQKTKNHKCEYCNHATTTSTYLKKHIKAVHQKTKSHKCQYCNHATSSSTDLKKHINAVHHKIKNYKCQYCDYSASRGSHIELHIHSVHHKIKNYICGHCQYTASTAWTLKMHIMSIHNKINNHKCEHCNYTARQVSSIKRHISAVHFKTTTKYKCDSCDYVANDSWHVRVHMQTRHK